MANGCRIKRLFPFLFYLWMAKLFRCEGGYDVPEFRCRPRSNLMLKLGNLKICVAVSYEVLFAPR